jgi:ribosome-binding ATPase YchF (GTP1/OBG family)
MGLDEPGLNRVIRAGYKLLGLQTYFTAGEEGSARLDDQGRIHRPAGGRRDPYRFREGLHPRRNHRLRRLRPLQGRGRREAMPASCASKARNTSCKEGDVLHFRFNV